MTKILIIDSNILFREGLSNLLRQEPGITDVWQTASFEEAAAIIEPCQPDLVLLDSETLNRDSAEEIKLLPAQSPETKVIVLCSNRSEEQFLQVMRSGARGYLSKKGSLNALLASIRAIERGEAAIPRSMVGVLLDEFCRLTPVLHMEGMDLLTPREKIVLRELGIGLSNRQISETLGIAENTVKVHVHNILEKLNLKNRRQAARFAHAHLAELSQEEEVETVLR